MILTSLARYYRRLSSETDVAGHPKVPPYGFSEEKIGWVLVLDADGLLVDVVPHLTDDKKPQPRLMSVPRPEKRTSGVKPNFLWDKTAYALGVEANKDKATAKEQPFRPSEKTFAAFRELHLEALKDTQDEGLLALRRFLERWQPEQFAHPPCLPDMLDANVVFRLDGTRGYIHQREAAQALWAGRLKSDDAEQGLCLVSGEQAPIARLHPAIKGRTLTLAGGQSSGCSIVAFNQDSFKSYGKEKGANAPVSEQAAFAYTTALNYLLRNDDHCLTIGDASTVFWAEAATSEQAEAAEGFFAAAMTPPNDEQENQKIFDILAQMAKGRPLREIDPNLDDQTRFYILGLAPNASRISIRFWLDTTFGKLAENIKKHRDDLSINPPAWGAKPPSVWRILLETTPKRKGADGRLKKSESKDIPPQLAGEYMRAILTGRHYPQTMLSRMIGRIRSDGFISGLRVAVIKSVLKRNNLCKEEFDMGLNEETQDIPYRLGRLFAIIELAQSSALGELNAGVRDKFYGGASSSPHSTFPLLLDNYRTHISGLRKGKKAKWVTGDSKKLANWLENKVGEIVSVFDAETPFPRHLSLEEQGRFVIGYYQQRFKKYSKQEGGDIPEDIEQANHLNTESDSEDE
ncbi:type I-C CRISPR-associated protein Cas8c/Csd1 [Neisseria shayeganii]|uniref:Csd1 family CRISPR-associated protein n=1 Tax=Neisseria shayeganii 871 TaxID=1032488 RepID=G4CEG7_9NEIS|nr:type I-C CRISPR-associated protein Cas8c/Csd1 [Neisseria shayeganii]EGY53774.1 csd1 family CRISPR-associated protein [Neisseria shayeganii 871]